MAEILINGIELSKEGYTEIRLYDDGSVLYKAKDNIYQNYADIQFKDAKAQELPPHDELISRTGAKEKIRVLFKCNECSKDCSKCQIYTCILLIDLVPAVLEANKEKTK